MISGTKLVIHSSCFVFCEVNLLKWNLCSLLMRFLFLLLLFLGGGGDRTPMDRDFPGHYSSDEEWHGYINNNDRVLLKVRCFIFIP